MLCLPLAGTRQIDEKHTVSIPLLQQDTQRQMELCGQELCPGQQTELKHGLPVTHGG